MADAVIQVIANEEEIAGLLFFGYDPWYEEGRLHAVTGQLKLDEAFRLSGLCSSLGDARRVISQGGAYVQGERCSSDEEFWSRPMIFGRYLLLRRGRKRISLLEAVPVICTIRCVTEKRKT